MIALLIIIGVTFWIGCTLATLFITASVRGVVTVAVLVDAILHGPRALWNTLTKYDKDSVLWRK